MHARIIESVGGESQRQEIMATMPTSAAEVNDVGVGPHNGREARNLAEKHRRDKLNASIQELATMVPHVANSTRRLDKTAVLRFAAHGLRLKYVFGKSMVKTHGLLGADNEADRLKDVDQPQLTDALMQLLDSFFITLTCHGQIVVISASVEQLLGHCQSDLYGQNILNVTHPEDQALLLQQLIPHDMEALIQHNDYRESDHTPAAATAVEEDDGAPDDFDDEYYRVPSPRTQLHLADIDKRLRADRRCFTVRLARAGTRSEATRSYEIVKMDGCFRRSDCSASAGNFPIVSQLIRRTRSSGAGGSSGVSSHPGLNVMQHDAIAQAALHGISGNDIVFVAMARIIRPPKMINRFLDANQLEYRTRHLIDGRIIDCDQRIGLVAGYMKDEVRNLSPFSFMHQDDVRWVIVALRQMYDCNSDYGESCYRLLSRNGNFIYLQSKGYLEIDKSTNKVHSFICVNTLLTEEEGRRKVQEMKNKFSVIIKTKIPSNSLQDVPASQNPQQLERIVLYLIENLQKRSCVTVGSGGAAAAATSSHGDQIRYAKTPPLALVPPEPSSVKNSISKSVSIINVTAARNLHYCLKSPASAPGSDISLSPASSIDHGDELTESIASPLSSATSVSSIASQRPSVLQMKTLPATQTITNQPSAIEQTSFMVDSFRDDLRMSSFSGSSPSPSPPTPSAAALPTSHKPVQQKLQSQISVLKRLHSNNAATCYVDDGISPAKRNFAHRERNSNTSNVIVQATAAGFVNLSNTSTLCQQQNIHLCTPPSVPHQSPVDVNGQAERRINITIGQKSVQKARQQIIVCSTQAPSQPADTAATASPHTLVTNLLDSLTLARQSKPL